MKFTIFLRVVRVLAALLFAHLFLFAFTGLAFWPGDPTEGQIMARVFVHILVFGVTLVTLGME